MAPDDDPPNDDATTGEPAPDDPTRHRRRREIASPGIVRVEAPTEEELADATERRAASKMRRGAVATVLAAGMVGLRDALEGSPNDDPAIVLEVAGDPLKDDEALEVRVGESPTDTEVIVRPWLAEEGAEADAEADPDDDTGDPPPA